VTPRSEGSWFPWPPGQPPDPAIPPYVRENEEAFLSSLGWGLQFNDNTPGLWEREVTDGLGLEPSKIVYSDLRTIFVAMRDLFLDHEGFNWVPLRAQLWRDDHRDEWSLVADIMTNRFSTVGAVRHYRREIEAYAAGAGLGSRGWR
jgi:hypothetical protein